MACFNRFIFFCERRISFGTPDWDVTPAKPGHELINRRDLIAINNRFQESNELRGLIRVFLKLVEKFVEFTFVHLRTLQKYVGVLVNEVIFARSANAARVTGVLLTFDPFGHKRPTAGDRATVYECAPWKDRVPARLGSVVLQVQSLAQHEGDDRADGSRQQVEA
jgi:hypothetical protein